MKQELIDLVIKHKFSSKFLYRVAYKYSTKEDLRYLFWMTELQQWLREVHNIHVVCNLFITDLEEKEPNYIVFCYDLNNKSMVEDFIDCFTNYEKGLEAGLLEALKLIK